MRIEVEFLDEEGVRLVERDFLYDRGIPIPNDGETVFIEGGEYRISKRTFIYLSGLAGLPDLKVSLSCADIRPSNEARRP